MRKTIELELFDATNDFSCVSSISDVHLLIQDVFNEYMNAKTDSTDAITDFAFYTHYLYSIDCTSEMQSQLDSVKAIREQLLSLIKKESECE